MVLDPCLCTSGPTHRTADDSFAYNALQLRRLVFDCHPNRSVLTLPFACMIIYAHTPNGVESNVYQPAHLVMVTGLVRIYNPRSQHTRYL